MENVKELALHYSNTISFIEGLSGFPDSVLHIYAGLFILALTRILTGWKISSMAPLAVVILLEFANETSDYVSAGAFDATGTGSDVFHTLLIPTVLSSILWFRALRQRNSAPELMTLPATDMLARHDHWGPPAFSPIIIVSGFALLFWGGSEIAKGIPDRAVQFAIMSEKPTPGAKLEIKPKPMNRLEFMRSQWQQFEERDLNGDGIVTPEESRIFLKNYEKATKKAG